MSATLDEKTFLQHGSAMLKKLDRALSDIDGLDVDLSGDILNLGFEDGTTYVVNTHSAARQIWAAAERRAWHFTPDLATGKWIEPRDGSELVEVLSGVVSRKLGRPVALKP